MFDNPEDAMVAFKAMLGSHGISSTMKWPDVQKTCSKDRRWNILRTTGEKKQVSGAAQLSIFGCKA